MHNWAKIIGLSIISFNLFSCASSGSSDNVQATYLDESRVDSELLNTAKSIQTSIRVMETTTNARALKGMTSSEIRYAKEQMRKVPPGLEKTMTNTSFPSLRALVAEAAAMSNYRFEEYGKRKKLYLTMDTAFRPIVDVLRDAGNQVKGQAWVCVYPSPSPSQTTNGVIAIKYDGDCSL